MIKRIFCPTDFSDKSLVSMKTAYDIAVKVQGTLVLMHTFHITGKDVSVGFNEKDISQLEYESEEKLNEVIESLIDYKPSVNVSFEKIVKQGFAVDEIIRESNRAQADLVVLYTKGIHGLAEKVAGSVAGNVLSSTNIPVLIIPAGLHHVDFSHIVFASSFSEEEEGLLNSVLEYGKLFQSKITILHVQENVSIKDRSDAAHYALKNNLLEKGIDQISIDLIESKHIEDGINKYAKEQNAGLLIMAREKRSFWAKLFNKSSTTKMAHHTKIPLIAMHKVNA